MSIGIAEERRMMVLELNSGKTRPVRENPTLSSASVGWGGVLLEESSANITELQDVCSVDHVVVLQLDGPLSLEWHADGESIRKEISPGQISIVPANLPFSVRNSNSGRTVTVAFDRKMFACAAAELGSPEVGELRSVFGVDDPLARELVNYLRAEAAAARPEGQMYAESLAATLAGHVIYRYAESHGRKLLGVVKGLSKAHLRKSIEFIHDRLPENISLTQLAQNAELSPFHFTRIFKKSTGISPHDYINRCRVERARQLLLRGYTRVTDVALEVGFCDQSHLSRHFKRVLGVTPAAFARSVAPRWKAG